ncbi:MAG: BrnA antitoxin family protein [Hydrogenophaga sp.]|nr:BrnA antitoxin family protein [Hydrogenophaga sp.]MDZ4237726.1 BrnA antitoxin family protein [Hydrogenophaga sp.]
MDNRPHSALFFMMQAETEAFAADVLESLNQAKRGECVRLHNPEDMTTYKAHGRPVDSTKKDTKRAVTVRDSPDVLEAFSATGKGWQARMNEALKTGYRHTRLFKRHGNAPPHAMPMTRPLPRWGKGWDGGRRGTACWVNSQTGRT